MHDSLISVLCRLFIMAFIATNNCLRPELDMEVFYIIMFESNAILTRVVVRLAQVSFYDEYHLIDIFAFLKYILPRLVEAGLQILQNANHKL